MILANVQKWKSILHNFCPKIKGKNDTFRTVITVEPNSLEPEAKVKVLVEPVETGTECLQNFRTGTVKF